MSKRRTPAAARALSAAATVLLDSLIEERAEDIGPERVAAIARLHAAVVTFDTGAPADQVVELRDGHYAVVGDKVFGPWPCYGAAKAGLQVEQHRAEWATRATGGAA